MGAPLLKFLLNFRLNLRDWGSTSPRVEGRPRRRLRRGRTTRGKRVPYVPINVQIVQSGISLMGGPLFCTMIFLSKNG
jgi:hypothetical protein